MLTIQKAKLSDTPMIVTLMQEAFSLLPDSSWYVADDEDFVYRHIIKSGFVLNGFWEDAIAGFLMVRIPREEEDNLGYSLISKWEIQNLNPTFELLKTAHIESTAVRPIFRGHQIQKQLIAEAVTILKRQNFHHLMATVHPDNKASLISFQKNDFQIISTVKKYGGLNRHILYRPL